MLQLVINNPQAESWVTEASRNTRHNCTYITCERNLYDVAMVYGALGLVTFLRCYTAFLCNCMADMQGYRMNRFNGGM
jgi:hypothetical protein